MTGKQRVAGVARFQVLANLGGLAVGGRRHDCFGKLLQAPAILLELGCEPIENFGVRGAVALRAEVFRGADDAYAEQLLPDAVHFDARG